MNPCYIKRITGKDIRAFREIDVRFGPGFNFITGPNGSGKTTILACASMVFSWNWSAFSDSRYGENPDVFAHLACQGQEDTILGLKKREGQSTGFRMRNSKGVFSYTNRAEVAGSGYKKGRFLPPLILGAYRRIDYKAIGGVAKELDREKARELYLEKGYRRLNGTDMPDVKQWLVNRYFFSEKEWAVLERRNWAWFLDGLNHVAPNELELEFRRVGRDMEPVFAVNGQECFLEELSAGLQAVLSMILAVFEWVESINEGDDQIVEHAGGSVLIDELDAHLHPEWQLTLREGLERMFPNLQFIVTTHSPHLLASARPGEIIKLGPLSETLIAKPQQQSYAGWTTDQILKDVMDVVSLENKVYMRLLNQAMEAEDMAGLKVAYDALEQVAHPSDKMLPVLQMKMASMELEV